MKHLLQLTLSMTTQRIQMKSVMLVYWIFLFAAVADGSSKINETVNCVFSKFRTCYQPVSGLGANTTQQSISNIAMLNATCRSSNSSFNTCLTHIPLSCNVNPSVLRGPINEISGLVSGICHNGTEFLNSSTCVNQNIDFFRNCYARYAKNNFDTKSVCCSNLNIRKCIQSGLKTRCTYRQSSYRNHLIEVYDSYTAPFCKSFIGHCNKASSFYLSFGTCLYYLVFLLSVCFTSTKF